MRFNLKNRPRQVFERGSMAWYEWCKKKTTETEEWFKGFEKELREMRKARCPKDMRQICPIIKEILGEQP